jgi:hypothetical protein
MRTTGKFVDHKVSVAADPDHHLRSRQRDSDPGNGRNGKPSTRIDGELPFGLHAEGEVGAEEPVGGDEHETVRD